MRNPFDKATDPVEHRAWAQGYTMGQMHRYLGQAAAASRKWSRGFRYGYSDGFSKGEVL